MTTYTLSGVVLGPSGALNGSQVTAYASTLFSGAVPTVGTAAPSGGVVGTTVFGPVTTGTNFGGPGQWEITGVTGGIDYYILVSYPTGATGATNYWTYDDSLLFSSGVTTFSGDATGLLPSTATSGAVTLSGTLNVANGGTGVTTSTGTGSTVRDTSPTLVTPALGAATATSLAATGEVSGTDLKATGITGATAGNTRLVGSTTAGAPASGTFAVGDVVVDQTGTLWICTTAGTVGSGCIFTNEVSQSLVNRSATAQAGTGEFTIYGTGGASGKTITLPANPVNGALYQIKNLSPYTVNILGGTQSISVSGTIYSASTPYTIPTNAAYTFAWNGGVWYCIITTDINKMGGLPLAVAGGGTGLTTATAANNAIYSTSSSALTAGTLPVLAGGTGVTSSTGSGNNVLSTSPTLTTPTLSGNTTAGTINSTTIPSSATLLTTTTGVTTFAGGTTGLTPASATSGAISLAGTLAVANGGTGNVVGQTPAQQAIAYGTVAETLPRYLVSASQTPNSSIFRTTAVYLTAGQVVSSITVMTDTTAGASLSNQWAGLFTLSGTTLTLVAASAGQTLFSMAAQQAFTYNIATIASGASTTYTVPTSGLYYVGSCISGTTPPSLASGPSMKVAAYSSVPYPALTATGSALPVAIGTTYTTAASSQFIYYALN